MNDVQKSVQIAHVLFLDVVGYSRETTTAQGRLVERLNRIVTGTTTYTEARARDAVLPLPTGDGMVLLFFGDVPSPAQCASEVSRVLHREADAAQTALVLRMGIHSGLVQRQVDIAGKENMVGEAINTAQRVMDFADGGHILLSAQYATWLQQFDNWVPFIAPIGEATAKHGQRLFLYNLSSNLYGRSTVPTAMVKTSDAPGTLPRPGDQNAQRVVMLYKRDTQPDVCILEFIEERMIAEGLEVFVDRHDKISAEWVRESEKQIRASDAVVAIVSPQSLQSEMLEYELQTAQDQVQKSGKPIILPVYVGADSETGGTDLQIAGSLNHFVWNSAEDDHRLAAGLISAIREPLKPRPSEIRLEPVGGAIPPDSPFYIERPCDYEFMDALAARESILLIKGARQMGKTSLQARGIQRTREMGWRCGVTDFQKLSSAQMETEDSFYRLLAMTLSRQMKFTYDFAGKWDDILGANLNMENFLRDLIDADDAPLFWYMDEVDKLFLAPFAGDFFGLVRSWHNSRSTEPSGQWAKLTIVIAYATEAHLFIQDLNQSPFNVGRRFDLEDFNLQQILDLNNRYGSPLRSYTEAEHLHALVGGQPFLVRRALDALASQQWDFAHLTEEADRDSGPFSDHLKRVFVSIARLPEVAAFVRDLLGGAATPAADQSAYYRLLAAGIVRQERDGSVRFRCDLYRRYLTMHLH